MQLARQLTLQHPRRRSERQGCELRSTRAARGVGLDGPEQRRSAVTSPVCRWSLLTSEATFGQAEHLD